MKIEIGKSTVRFSQIIIGKCFRTAEGKVMMRIKDRDGDKSHAIDLSTGEATYFANLGCHVTPLNLKVVEDTCSD